MKVIKAVEEETEKDITSVFFIWETKIKQEADLEKENHTEKIGKQEVEVTRIDIDIEVTKDMIQEGDQVHKREMNQERIILISHQNIHSNSQILN